MYRKETAHTIYSDCVEPALVASLPNSLFTAKVNDSNDDESDQEAENLSDNEEDVDKSDNEEDEAELDDGEPVEDYTALGFGAL